MIGPRRGRTALGGLAVLLAALSAGCSSAPAAVPSAAAPSASPALTAFGDCAALVAHMRGLALPYVSATGFGDGGLDDRDRGGGWTEAAIPARFGAGLGGPQTNHGVLVRSGGDVRDLNPPDPAAADATTSDGRLLVSFENGTLRVVDLTRDRPRVRGTLNLTDHGFEQNGSVLLAGRRALVLGSIDPARRPARAREHNVALGLVDLRDPDLPRLVAAEAITGGEVSARLVGGVVRIVLASGVYLPFQGPQAGAAGEAAAAAHNREVVESATAADWLPSRRPLEGSTTSPLVACDHVRAPAADSGLGTVSMLALDLARDDAFTAADATAIVADNGGFHPAGTRTYLVTYPGAWGRAPEDPGAYGVASVRRTDLHLFDTPPGRGTEYLGSGTVPGSAPGGPALSELGDVLRVYVVEADTPVAAGAAERPVVHLVSRQNGGLETVGRITGIDPGTYGIGWVDGLLATSALRRGHGVHVVEVGAPAQAAAGAGELDIPEFSGLVRRAGGHLVLGVGDTRLVGGKLQVHAFDVTDPSSPRRVDLLDFDALAKATGASSRNGVYLPESRTLVLPVNLRVAKQWAAGLVAVHVAKDGTLVEAGRWLGLGRAPRLGTEKSPQISFLVLPNGRLAALADGRVTILDADDLAVRGSGRLR